MGPDAYGWVRPLLFRLDPETAHGLALGLLRLVGRLAGPAGLRGPAPSLPGWQAAARLGFPARNPVGLAAGFDKDGTALWGLAALGFGFLEVGTVTPRPQSGQPRPRLFRLPRDGALLNRLGFPSAGAARVAANLAAARQRGPLPPVGVNIGMNRTTPPTEAAADYRAAARILAPLADYLVVNVSSPNTPGLRELQARSHLLRVLGGVREELERAGLRSLPLWVKVAPDLQGRQVQDLVETSLEAGVRGIVATNTTVSRAGLRTPPPYPEGGLSGRPLAPLARRLVFELAQAAGGRLALIGCGGIFRGEDAWKLLRAGADAVQLYTGFVYRGPGTARALVRELAGCLAREPGAGEPGRSQDG